MNKKQILILLVFLFSAQSTIASTTIDQLIKKYGKNAIMKIIAPKINKKFSIDLDGTIKQVSAPNPDYITSSTLMIDIERSGMTLQSIENSIQQQTEKTKYNAQQKARYDAELHALAAEQNRRTESKAQRLQDEDRKFFAEASEEELNQFKQAHQRGILLQEEQVIEEPCKSDLKCWAKKQINLQYECIEKIPKLAKFDSKWSNKWIESKFSYSKWIDKKTGTFTYIGDTIKFQNVFGAWQNMIYECDVNPETKTIIDIRIRPGRL